MKGLLCWRLLAAALGLAWGAVAQVEAFDRAAAAFQAAATSDAAARRQAADAAVAAFLRIDPTAPAWAERREQAAAGALDAAEPERALQWLAAPGPLGEAGRVLRLRALLRLERGAEAAFWIRADPPAVATAAVLAEEPAAFRCADRLLRSGDARDGVLLFETMARAAPGDPIRLGNLGLTYRHVGWLTEAENAYREALRLGPGDDQTWNDYGLFLRGQGRHDEALAAFRRGLAAEAQPGNGPSITNLMHLSLVRPELLPPPLPEAARALRLRPDAAMLRRLTLDVLLDAPVPQREPDKAAPNR